MLKKTKQQRKPTFVTLGGVFFSFADVILVRMFSSPARVSSSRT